MAPLARPTSSRAPPTAHSRRAAAQHLDVQPTPGRKEALWEFWASVLSRTSWLYDPQTVRVLSTVAAALVLNIEYSILEQFGEITDVERGMLRREFILRRRAGRRLRLLRSLLVVILLTYVVHLSLLRPTVPALWRHYLTARHAGLTVTDKHMQQIIIDSVRSAAATFHSQVNGFAATIKRLIVTILAPLSGAMSIIRRPLLWVIHASRALLREVFRKAFAPFINIWPPLKD